MVYGPIIRRGLGRYIASRGLGRAGRLGRLDGPGSRFSRVGNGAMRLGRFDRYARGRRARSDNRAGSLDDGARTESRNNHLDELKDILEDLKKPAESAWDEMYRAGGAAQDALRADIVFDEMYAMCANEGQASIIDEGALSFYDGLMGFSGEGFPEMVQAHIDLDKWRATEEIWTAGWELWQDLKFEEEAVIQGGA